MRDFIGIYLLLAVCGQPQPMTINLILKSKPQLQERMLVLNQSTVDCKSPHNDYHLGQGKGCLTGSTISFV